MGTRPSDPRSEVLRRVCSLLPADDAVFIESLDPTAYETYVHAYVAARRHQVPLDADLNSRIVQILFEFHDAQAAAALGQASRARLPIRVAAR
ncbi:MAG: hypothetical protein ACJ716_09460 [Marmoricola sp.]